MEQEEKELTPRQIAAKKEIAKRRKAGYERWLKARRKEIAKEKEKERKRKEKEKEKKRKEREAAKHKRPVGRPKKRGRKRKKKSYYKKKEKPIQRKTWNYKIVNCKNNKQMTYIGDYSTMEDAYNKINELMTDSNNVVFPVQIHHADRITIPTYEYLILERNTDNKPNPVLRNEFGKLVEQRTNSENWIILDKFKYNIEEDFWVWGFNNKTERKTFQWIYDNIIIGRIESKYDIKRVMLYKNKILIKDDNEDMDMIICKTMSDSIRFYNLLQNWIEKDKIRQVFFLGSYNQRSDKRKALEDKIMDMTGWNRAKVQMRSTSKHIVKK